MIRYTSIIWLSVLLCFSVATPVSPEKAPCSMAQATVTFLKGEAHVLHGEGARACPLRINDPLKQGDKVTTGKEALIEIQLPDGSFIRFSENTEFSVTDLIYKGRTRERSFKFKMFLGRAWANAKELAGRGKNFEIVSETAVAGIKGTTFRMNVEKDKSVVVKVYRGDVYVASPPGEIPKHGVEIGRPREIPGPSEVPGPREVTLQEWEYIVREMQEIKITAQGKALKPSYFSPEADMNDWVLWNQQRDALVR